MSRLEKLVKYCLFRLFFPLVRRLKPRGERAWLYGCVFGCRDNAWHLFLHERKKGRPNVYWVARKKADYRRLRGQGVPVLMWGSLRHFLRTIDAHAVFFTHHLHDVAPVVGPRTITVNLWHGICLKPIGRDSRVDGDRNGFWKLLAGLRAWDYSKADYMIAAHEDFVDILANAMGLPRSRVLPFGQPRTDVLFENDIEGEWVTYAPTFRDSGDDRKVIQPLLDAWARVHAATGRKLCLKLHPSIVNAYDFGSLEHVTIVDPALSTEDVLKRTAVLITDCSSIVFDYEALGRPALIYFPDVEEYARQRGGLYFELDDIFGGYKRFNDANELVDVFLTGVAESRPANRQAYTKPEACLRISQFFANLESGK